jgi:hypothetical protein
MADVSGGSQSGMRSQTTTIVCLDCKELQDVLSTVMNWSDPEPFKSVEIRCEIDVSHRVQVWQSGDPCPKCGMAVERGDLTMLWD